MDQAMAHETIKSVHRQQRAGDINIGHQQQSRVTSRSCHVTSRHVDRPSQVAGLAVHVA